MIRSFHQFRVGKAAWFARRRNFSNARTLKLAGVMTLIIAGTLFLTTAAAPTGLPRPPASAAIERGQALLASGRIAEAEKAFLEATRAEPDSVVAWSSLGQARYQAKRWEEALEAFERALLFAPSE